VKSEICKSEISLDSGKHQISVATCQISKSCIAKLHKKIAKVAKIGKNLLAKNTQLRKLTKKIKSHYKTQFVNSVFWKKILFVHIGTMQPLQNQFVKAVAVDGVHTILSQHP